MKAKLTLKKALVQLESISNCVEGLIKEIPPSGCRGWRSHGACEDKLSRYRYIISLIESIKILLDRSSKGD